MTQLRQVSHSGTSGKITEVAITTHPVLMEKINIGLPPDVANVLNTLAPPWDGKVQINPPVDVKEGQKVTITFDTETRSAKIEVSDG